MSDLPETEYPPMYGAVLATQRRLLAAHPGGVNTEEIGIQAWQSLTPEQQLSELRHVLGAYVHRVGEEENSKLLDTRAADTTHTYLGDHDTSILWDTVLGVRPDKHNEVPAEREALLNVLCELELLQHRLAMREEDGE